MIMRAPLPASPNRTAEMEWAWTGALSPGEQHLVGRRDGRGGTDRRGSEPRVAQDQRAALQAGCVGRELAGPGELGIDVLPVPDVTRSGPAGSVNSSRCQNGSVDSSASRW